jgi:hypothetical protein
VSLTDSLETLVAEHDRIGSTLRSRLGPGVAAATVQSTLRELGLVATDELVELFGWHEIVDAPEDQARIEWCWSAAPFRLEEAARDYRSSMEIGGLTKAEVEELARDMHPASSFTGFWRADWLPILYGSPETYAIECGPEAGRGPGAVWRVNWHPDSGFPTMQVAESLTAFVDRIVELFRLGGYEWNEHYRSVEPVHGVFERLGLGDDRPWPSTP